MSPDASETGEPPRIAPSEVLLTTPIAHVAGVRRDRARVLARMGLVNVGRLVAHLPFRHEFEEAETRIDALEPGAVVSARGEITATRIAGRGARGRFEAVLHDGDGRLDLVFFNQAFLHKQLHPGDRIRVRGKAQQRGPGLQMANPSWERLDDTGGEPDESDARHRPIYPASEGITSVQIEQTIRLVLPAALRQIEDHLSEEYRAARMMPALAEAYRMLHAPEGEQEIAEGRRRLAYDELLLLQLGVHVKRAHLRRSLTAPALEWTEQIDERIRARIPFTLTPAQDGVVQDLVRDLTRSVPGNRLVQGDVGSGKTVVALYAMLLAVNAGKQAALMAPTEILAEQHYTSVSRMLEGSRVRVALLTGSLSKADADSVRAQAASGDIDIIIGTHALVTEKAAFRDLAVAVIDEQHRFGVQQRAKLRTKGAGAGGTETPHVVVMTATPIPRTIGLTLFGDLDLSTIDAMPPGRTPVRTSVHAPDERDSVYAEVRAAVERGEQAYVVVPAIDTGVTSGDESIRDLRAVHDELENTLLRGIKVAAVHGRLKRDTRENIMGRFRLGKIDVLVATTVIEVGVDVPNATAIVIEHAERFGVAQLHQLRGRVGRGDKPGRCLLVGEPSTEDGAKRLELVAKHTNGFKLAEADFDMRGPGEIVGARQSGLPPFKVADLIRDLELLEMARRDASAWVDASPQLDRPEDAVARRRLLKAYGDALGLADVG